MHIRRPLYAVAIALMFATAMADVQINEVISNPPGNDNDISMEFIEFVNNTTELVDLSAYSLIVLEGDGAANLGLLDVFMPLSGSIAPNGGVWVLAQNYADFGLDASTPGYDRQTLGLPSGAFWAVNSGNQDFENGTVTFLLVKNVVVNGSLDASTDFDPLNDGTLTVPAALSFDPETDIVDSLSWTDNGTADKEYALASQGKRYGFPGFTPDGFAKIIGVGDEVFRLNNLITTPPFQVSTAANQRFPAFTEDYYMTPGAPNELVNPPVEGDTNGDGCVDDADLTAVILDFGAPPSGSNGSTDVSGDGIVDDADITLVILNFGVGC